MEKKLIFGQLPLTSIGQVKPIHVLTNLISGLSNLE